MSLFDHFKQHKEVTMNTNTDTITPMMAEAHIIPVYVTPEEMMEQMAKGQTPGNIVQTEEDIGGTPV